MLILWGDIAVTDKSMLDHTFTDMKRHGWLLWAVALRYRYCRDATFTVAVAVVPLHLVEKNGDDSAAHFYRIFSAACYRYFWKANLFF